MLDALAQLALMSKAKMVFESPGTFLSFPALSPVSYKAAELRFDAPNTDPSVLSEFSLLVNSCPQGAIFQMETDSYLWEKYQEILNNGVVARGLANAAETAAYDAAVALLTTTDANGFVTDSVQMATYKQYRDASIKAAEDYKTQQLTAESSTDQAVRDQWTSVDEPRYRAAMQQIENEWKTKGSKDQIEQALQVQKSYAANSPQTTWTQWSRLFDPSIDIQTDPISKTEFALTSYSPQGIFDHDWQTFHLTRTEINQLAEQAPAVLKAIFAAEGSSSTVDALSFEYCSVAINRPWFRSAVFDARFWRLPEGFEPLSDGGDPPQGAWPAYAAALIFVRNVTLTMKTDSPGPTPTVPTPASQIFMADRTMFRSTALSAARPAVFMRSATPLKTMTMAQPMTRTTASAPLLARADFSVMRTTPSVSAAPAVSRVNVASRLGTFQTLPIELPHPVPPPPPTPTPSTVTLQGTRDEVTVLALICKRIPKSPDPDPALTW